MATIITDDSGVPSNFQGTIPRLHFTPLQRETPNTLNATIAPLPNQNPILTNTNTLNATTAPLPNQNPILTNTNTLNATTAPLPNQNPILTNTNTLNATTAPLPNQNPILANTNTPEALNSRDLINSNLSQITPQTGLQSDSNPFVTRYQRPRNIFQHYENIFNRISEQISERLGRSTVTRVDIAMPGNNHLNPHDQQINEAIQGLGQMSEEIRAIRNQPMTIQQLMKYLVDILDTIHTMSVEIMLAAARSLGVEQSVVGFLNMIQTFYNGAETFFKGIIILGVGAGFCYVTLKTTRFGLRIITNYIFPMGSNIRFELYAT
jgi:hypothetical protein